MDLPDCLTEHSCYFLCTPDIAILQCVSKDWKKFVRKNVLPSRFRRRFSPVLVSLMNGSNEQMSNQFVDFTKKQGANNSFERHPESHFKFIFSFRNKIYCSPDSYEIVLPIEPMEDDPSFSACFDSTVENFDPYWGEFDLKKFKKILEGSWKWKAELTIAFCRYRIWKFHIVPLTFKKENDQKYLVYEIPESEFRIQFSMTDRGEDECLGEHIKLPTP